MIPVSAAYFFLLAGQFVFTYLPRFLTGMGWTATSAGALFAAFAISRAFAMPVWAHLADKSDRHIKFAKRLFIAAVPALILLGLTGHDYLIVVGMIGLGLTAGAVFPLLDTFTMHTLGQAKFGHVRLWGSAGFGLAAIAFAVAGTWLTHGDLAALSPTLFMVLMFCGGASLLVIKDAPDHEEDTSNAQAPKFSFTLLLMAVLWFGHWVSQSPYNLFLVFLCEDKGFSARIPGLAVATGILVELWVMRVGHRVIKRVGAPWVLAVAIGLSGVRWWLSAHATSPEFLIGVQAIHGLTFGAYFLCIMDTFSRQIPKSRRGTAQALLYVFVFGMGAAVGNSVSGYFVDTYSAVSLFEAAAYLEFGLFVVAIAAAAMGVDRVGPRRHERRVTQTR